MSTKIYNGFEVKTSSIDEAFALINSLREQARKMGQQETAKFIANVATGLIDKQADKLSRGEAIEGQVRPWSDANMTLLERQAEMQKTGGRDPAVDIQLEVVLIPVRDKILGMLFCERPEWSDWFKGQPFIADYAYWDNSDPDENISQADWDEREAYWAEAMPGVATPAEVGLTIQLHASMILPPGAKEILAHVKPIAVRAANRAQDNVMARKIEEVRQNEPPTDEQPSFTEIMGYLGLARKYMETPEGQAEIARETERLSQILPEITRDILFDGVDHSATAQV